MLNFIETDYAWFGTDLIKFIIVKNVVEMKIISAGVTGNDVLPANLKKGATGC